MRICTMKLESVTPYSQSRPHEEPKESKELHDDYDKRTWIYKAHWTEDGQVFIPGVSLTYSIQEAAKMLGLKVPGKGNSLYTKHFERGILIVDDIMLGIHKDSLAFERLYMDANGKRGSGTRVWRRFPLIPSWKATVQVHVIDSAITTEVFERVVKEAGVLVGIGRYRPQNRGTKGRFKVTNFAWKSVE